VNVNEYQQLARRTEANQEPILARLTLLGPQAMRLDNAARGLAADAGEVCTAVMRHIEYGRELDVPNLLEEVGDCLWRLSQLCDAAGITLEMAMEANIQKLRVRYPDKYSEERAVENGRDRQAEAESLRRSLDQFMDERLRQQSRQVPINSHPLDVSEE